MKKLHSLAFYALVTPVITLGVGSVLAQQAADSDINRAQQSGPSDMPAAGQYGSSQSAADRANMGQAGMEHRGYLSAAPADGMQTSQIVGADVMTLGGEEVGPVEDLIVNSDGQVVAVIVSVGGFLGMGERQVAIGWHDITTSGIGDELELQIDETRESLGAAPEFESLD